METKAEVIDRIGELAGELATRFAEGDRDEHAHMSELCSPEAQRILAGMSVQALHLLDAVPAENEDVASVNVVGLARVTKIPKGTVSKVVQRLADAGALTRHRLPGNRKEVHVRLTPVGEEIRAAHRSLHEQMGSVVGDFLGRYSLADLDVVRRVLDDLVRMPREGVRFRPDLLD